MRASIVEDDTILGELLFEVRTDAGHDAIDVSRAEAARKLLLTRPFDAVMVDLCPGVDSGLSVAALATRCNPDCRVVMVTGTALV